MSRSLDEEGTQRIRESASLIGIDPPRHRLMRDIVSRVFTASAVARLEPRIESLANELLDATAPSGEMDLIADFAYPLPVTVIAEMLGVPAADRPTFKRWADGLFRATEEVPKSAEFSAVPDILRLRDEMNDYFRGIVEQGRSAPRDDLISGLVRAGGGRAKTF